MMRVVWRIAGAARGARTRGQLDHARSFRRSSYSPASCIRNRGPVNRRCCDWGPAAGGIHAYGAMKVGRFVGAPKPALCLAGIVPLLLLAVLGAGTRPGSVRRVSAVHAAAVGQSLWSAPQFIQAPNRTEDSASVSLAIDADGATTAVWTEFSLSSSEPDQVSKLVRAAVRPVGGHWRSASVVARRGQNPAVAVDAGG